MKKLFLFITALLFVACSKSDDNTSPPVNEIDKLPLATQIGANTVGCLVDGKAFLPYGDSPGSGGNPRCDYINDVFVLAFFQTGMTKERLIKNVVIGSQKEKIEQGKIYEFNEISELGQYARFIIHDKWTEGTYFEADEGELYISKFDRTAGIISGTFWFDAVNKKGEKVEIREGRFDMSYYGN